MLPCRSLLRVVPRRFLASNASSGGDQTGTEVDVQKKKVPYTHDSVGYKQHEHARDTYLNPLLTPPPRSPRTVEDFRHPERLGHWVPQGNEWITEKQDTYNFHELVFCTVFSLIVGLTLYYYAPDIKGNDWARREAFLRTAKREALGIPLIDRNVVDPERIVLPTEEELEGFEVTM